MSPAAISKLDVRVIPIASIDEPEWNSRLDLDQTALKELAASLETETGLINPITVEEISDRYLLVAGSRRLAAARLNGWSEIKAEVKPATDRVHRIATNISENMARSDLSLYEQARAVTQLRREGAKGPDITSLTGFSKQKISNLIAMFERLPPQIHEAWREGAKAANYNYLCHLAYLGTAPESPVRGQSPEIVEAEQLSQWNDRVKLTARFEGKIDADSGNGEDDDEDEPKKKKKKKSKDDEVMAVPYSRYLDLVRAVKTSRIAGAKLAIDCMRALIGETNRVKSVWDEQTQSVQ